jgi:raffinose/stachyose/melibiose transport system permease protein
MSATRFRVLPSNYELNRPTKQRQHLSTALLVTLFALPGMIIFFLFFLLPIAQSAVFSLYEWDGFGPLTDYVGLGNYQRLLDHSIFQMSVQHSVTIMVLALLIQLPLALGLALIVGRGKLRGRRIFRTVLFIPYVFSEIITAILWSYVLHPDPDGLVNSLLRTLLPGFQAVGWLGNPDTVIYVIFVVITWKYFGFHMILYMAGLQAIPQELEDACRVDGASERQALRYVTLPLLGPTIRLTVYLSILGSFQQFVMIWVLRQGGPANGSQVIATYLYKFGIQGFHLGYGSAVAMLLCAFMFVFSVVYQRFVMRRDYTADIAAKGLGR